MDFTITIPDLYVSGITATAYAESQRRGEPVTLQMVVQEAAMQAVAKACQDQEVGPFYVGPILPRFNQDGTPYTPQ